MTISEARGFCYGINEDGGDNTGCAEIIGLCDDYLEGAAAATTREECLAHCRSVRSGQFLEYALSPCNRVSEEARSQCETYCRRAFPPTPSEIAGSRPVGSAARIQ